MFASRMLRSRSLRSAFQPKSLSSASRNPSRGHGAIHRARLPGRLLFSSESDAAASGSPRRGPHPVAILAVASLAIAGYFQVNAIMKGRAQKEKSGTSSSKEEGEEEEGEAKSVGKKPGPVPISKIAHDITVIYVLGGPGSGKGTNCARLVSDFDFVHLSAGDLLREEQNRPNSEYGDLIRYYIREGLIVPMEVTIALLHRAMLKHYPSKKRFLIDGFPRAMDQALEFEKDVEARGILYFECPEEELMRRLLKRGETSGREDDNAEAIRKRFRTFRETSSLVIDHYGRLGKVYSVSCKGSMDDVYGNTKKIVQELLNVQ